MSWRGTNVIQVGEVLDKYELLERVGQGGMAVVYRGLDRTLKRVVAIKILHHHLSDFQEARDRFEREAQAVAKLRHDNILEIFDYSGADDAKAAGSSYIVTEFIDGRTLKQVITDRPIQFPELGAMVMLQVCRALDHAHAAGVLHRDVKPENIMVRSDGVVKLMDFGISHMLDLERLTVTGQLLGSPAYMAPEHVEGRQLDFRTDVFAAGIVLYQLCVGKLPFEGKNPHEVLKRIAECKFVDPRQANPQIGNRLGRIILRAMAAQPSDRYPAIGEMVRAIEAYLDESGVAADKIPGELTAYFAAPAAYEQALELRLVDHLTSRGHALLSDDQRSAALDVFDRVLTIDPDNQRVLAILDAINTRRRIRRTAWVVLGAAIVALCAYQVHRGARPTETESIDPTIALGHLPPRPITSVARDEVAPPIDAGTRIIEPDARSATAVAFDAGEQPVDPRPAIQHLVQISVSPAHGSQYQIGDGDWTAVPETGIVAQPIDRETVAVRARNACCGMEEATWRFGQGALALALRFKPGFVVARCDAAGRIDVKVDGHRATLDHKVQIFFDESVLDSKTIVVEFITQDKVDTRRITVQSGRTETVTCGS